MKLVYLDISGGITNLLLILVMKLVYLDVSGGITNYLLILVFNIVYFFSVRIRRSRFPLSWDKCYDSNN